MLCNVNNVLNLEDASLVVNSVSVELKVRAIPILEGTTLHACLDSSSRWIAVGEKGAKQQQRY